MGMRAWMIVLAVGMTTMPAAMAAAEEAKTPAQATVVMETSVPKLDCFRPSCRSTSIWTRCRQRRATWWLSHVKRAVAARLLLQLRGAIYAATVRTNTNIRKYCIQASL
jgi:hypothetical protein